MTTGVGGVGRDKAIALIFDELRKAEAKFPGWPDDPVHGAAILGEEAGEVLKAALDFYYGRELDEEKLIKETSQVGAMALRFLFYLIDPAPAPSKEVPDERT